MEKSGRNKEEREEYLDYDRDFIKTFSRRAMNEVKNELLAHIENSATTRSFFGKIFKEDLGEIYRRKGDLATAEYQIREAVQILLQGDARLPQKTNELLKQAGDELKDAFAHTVNSLQTFLGIAERIGGHGIEDVMILAAMYSPEKYKKRP